MMRPSEIAGRSDRRRRVAAVLGGLALSAVSLPLAAAPSVPWTYDTSKRAEVAPASATSAALDALDAQPTDAGEAATDWFTSVFFHWAISSGCDVSSLPLGGVFVIR